MLLWSLLLLPWPAVAAAAAACRSTIDIDGCILHVELGAVEWGCAVRVDEAYGGPEPIPWFRFPADVPKHPAKASRVPVVHLLPAGTRVAQRRTYPLRASVMNRSSEKNAMV